MLVERVGISESAYTELSSSGSVGQCAQVHENVSKSVGEPWIVLKLSKWRRRREFERYIEADFGPIASSAGPRSGHRYYVRQ